MSCAVPFLVSRFQDFLFCAIIHGWLLVCGSNSVIKYCCKGFLCFRTSLLTKDQQIAQCLPLTPCHSRWHQCSHCLKGSRQTDISTDTAYRITLQHPDYHLNCQPGGFPATMNVEPWLGSNNTSGCSPEVQNNILKGEQLWPDSSWVDQGFEDEKKSTWMLQ